MSYFPDSIGLGFKKIFKLRCIVVYEIARKVYVVDKYFIETFISILYLFCIFRLKINYRGNKRSSLRGSVFGLLGVGYLYYRFCLVACLADFVLSSDADSLITLQFKV